MLTGVGQILTVHVASWVSVLLCCLRVTILLDRLREKTVVNRNVEVQAINCCVVTTKLYCKMCECLTVQITVLLLLLLLMYYYYYYHLLYARYLYLHS